MEFVMIAVGSGYNWMGLLFGRRLMKLVREKGISAIRKGYLFFTPGVGQE